MASGPRKNAVYARLRNLGINYKGKKRKGAQEPAEAAIMKAVKAQARMERTFAEITKPTWAEQTPKAPASGQQVLMGSSALVPASPGPPSPSRDPEVRAMATDGAARPAPQTLSG